MGCRYEFWSHYYIDGKIDKRMYEIVEGRVGIERKNRPSVKFCSTATIKGQMQEEE